MEDKIKQSLSLKRKGVHGKKHTVQDLRHELWVCHQKTTGWDMKNKLAEKYRAKVNYMLFHMRLIPVKKNTLKNWYMPDYQDVCNLEKEIGDFKMTEEKIKQEDKEFILKKLNDLRKSIAGFKEVEQEIREDEHKQIIKIIKQKKEELIIDSKRDGWYESDYYKGFHDALQQLLEEIGDKSV